MEIINKYIDLLVLEIPEVIDLLTKIFDKGSKHLSCSLNNYQVQETIQQIQMGEINKMGLLDDVKKEYEASKKEVMEKQEEEQKVKEQEEEEKTNIFQE